MNKPALISASIFALALGLVGGCGSDDGRPDGEGERILALPVEPACAIGDQAYVLPLLEPGATVNVLALEAGDYGVKWTTASGGNNGETWVPAARQHSSNTLSVPNNSRSSHATICSESDLAVSVDLPGASGRATMRAGYRVAPAHYLSGRTVVPLVQNRNAGFSTTLTITNPNTYAVEDIDILRGDVSVYSMNLGPLESRSVTPDDLMLFGSSTTNNRVLSLEVASEARLSVVATETDGRSRLASVGAPRDFTGEAPVLPLVNINNGGTITGVQIYNHGTRETEVELQYIPVGGGEEMYEQKDIPAGSSVTFGLDIGRSGERFVGSARVTGNSESSFLEATVNQLNRQTRAAGAYSGMHEASLDSTVSFPTFGNDEVLSGVAIMNLSNRSELIACEIFKQNGQLERTVLETVGPYKSHIMLSSKLVPGNFSGSMTCESHRGTPIAGVMNTLGNDDGMSVHEG